MDVPRMRPVPPTRPRPQPTRDPLDYVTIPLRYPYHVAVPLCLVLAAAVAACFVLPKKYRSTTLILVEKDKVPESFVARVATETAARRLNTLRQEIQSRTRLEKVARDLDPYHSLHQESISVVTDRMRQALEVNVKGSSNDAFSVEFVHTDPHKAMDVANRLTTLFIEEVTRERQTQVSEAYTFIDSELEEAREELERREQALRRFKESHMGSLPEQLASNLAALERLQYERQVVASDLRAAMERETLVEQRPELATAIDSLAELSRLKNELAALRTRYTDEHPEVRFLLGRISRLEQTLAERGTVRTIQAQLEQARLDVRTLKARQLEVERRTSIFTARVEESPRTEQELATLTRDFQKLKENYLTLLNKKLEAQMAAKLEERWKGEQFKILDPASLPDQHIAPNRLLIVSAGLVLGLALGLAAAFTADFLDHSIKNIRELEATLAVPLLATIPHIGPRAQQEAGGSGSRGGASRGRGDARVSASDRPGAAREFRLPRSG
jgi:polysaccharide chain length determinant protein (PEP-CTERM system associated)